MTGNKTFTIAHLSDPHICLPQGLRLFMLMNKRILGYLSWRIRRRFETRADILEILCRDVRAQKPDHIVVSGDLTHLGTSAELAEALQYLKALGPPDAVTVVPGNHDAYVAADWDQTFAPWQPYMSSDAACMTDDATRPSWPNFPIVRVRDKIALIGISTARPSAPFLAVGSIGGSQLQALERVLIDTGRRDLLRVVLIHHPPVAGVVRWRKRLTDARAFRTVVKRWGVELIVHGHLHDSSFAQLETPRGCAPVICVPSASALGWHSRRRARYHIYQIHQTNKEREMRLSVYRYSDKQRHFTAESNRHFHLPRGST